MKTKLFAALAVLLSWAIPAHAEGDFSGSFWGGWFSRAYYQNTGTFATNGSAFLMLPEIKHKPTDIYGGLFISVPTQDSVGAELDVRVGKTWNLGLVQADTRVAWYHFHAPGNTVVDVGNARLTMSREFKLGDGASMTPYGVVDLQRTLSPNTDTYVALAAGLGFKQNLWFIGSPTLRVNAEMWKYVATPAAVQPNVIGSVAMDLAFKPWSNNVSIGPRVAFGVGDITGAGTARVAGGIVVRAEF